MTFGSFTKVFGKVTEIKDKDLKNVVIGIDAFVSIFISSGVQWKSGLTNKNGEPTHHIQVCLNNIVKAIKNNVEEIWIFDNTNTKREKIEEVKKRGTARAKAKSKLSKVIKDIEAMKNAKNTLAPNRLAEVFVNYDEDLKVLTEEFKKLNCRNPNYSRFTSFINHIKFILDCLGIKYTTAPDQIEAEQLGAYLYKQKVISGMKTTDPDVLVFGCNRMYKKVRKQTGVYDVYELKHCLEEHDITHDQFVKLAVALGSDFAPKAKGVGPKTAIAKVKNDKITWTEAQLKAMDVFKEELTPEYEIVQNERTEESIQKLKEWLIKEQGFNAARLDKLLVFD